MKDRQYAGGCDSEGHSRIVPKVVCGSEQVPAPALSNDSRLGHRGHVVEVHQNLVALRIHGCGESPDESNTGKPNHFHAKTPRDAKEAAIGVPKIANGL